MSSSDVAISMRNLGKSYTITHNSERQSSLAEAITLAVKNPFKRQERESFWALRNVDLDIQRGDVVGIIGRNGAGKSTLLKILSRITEPTTGEAVLNGRVGSLLEVGTGFHQELTGRENIFLNGAILGMTKREISKRFDEIVDFAGVDKFLDTPVKRYSSGMYVRLAFAVAAHLNLEILIVDEVLAVGDAGFQKKCIGKMQDAASSGRTVLFVSHNMAVLQGLCTHGVLMQNGAVVSQGTISEAIESYLQLMGKQASTELASRTDRRGTGRSRLTRIDLTGAEAAVDSVATGQPAAFSFFLDNVRPGLRCAFTVYDQYGQPVSYFDSAVVGSRDNPESSSEPAFVCNIDELSLVPGEYRINVAIYDGHDIDDHVEAALVFEVEEGRMGGRPVRLSRNYGHVHIAHKWDLVPALGGKTAGTN